MKYSYWNLDTQAEGKIGEVDSRASFKTAEVLYKDISLDSNITMRNINGCILLQLVLNCIIANGNHQRLLYISPKRNGRELTDCAELQIAPSSVHLKTRCGAENLVPLAGNREIFKKHQERTMSFDWLFETFRISRGERFQSHLLGGTLLHVFLLSIQYLLDNTWIVMCGDISHVV